MNAGVKLEMQFYSGFVNIWCQICGQGSETWPRDLLLVPGVTLRASAPPPVSGGDGEPQSYWEPRGSPHTALRIPVSNVQCLTPNNELLRFQWKLNRLIMNVYVCWLSSSCVSWTKNLASFSRNLPCEKCPEKMRLEMAKCMVQFINVYSL